MKLKIEKTPDTGTVRVEVVYDTKKPPVVLEGQQLESLLVLIATAKQADRFRFEMEV